MMERLLIKLIDAKQGHIAVTTAWRETIKPLLQDGKRLTVEVRPEKRSDAQNRRLWSQLTDVSEQVNWHGQLLTSTEWKAVFSAALKRTKVVHGLDGGFVVCGQSTSQMSKAEMNELFALIEAFGSEHSVSFKAYGDQD